MTPPRRTVRPRQGSSGPDEGAHGCRTLPFDVDHLDRSASVPMDGRRPSVARPGPGRARPLPAAGSRGSPCRPTRRTRTSVRRSRRQRPVRTRSQPAPLIGSPDGHRTTWDPARISSAIPTAASAWSALGTGAPATAMYASPIVLIFSRPCRSASSSNQRKRSSSAAANSSGEERAACSVDPTASTKMTLTSSNASAIRSPDEALSWSTTAWGRMFSSRPSERSRSWSSSRWRRKSWRANTSIQ